VFQKAYSFLNEASNEIKKNVIQKSKIFNLKDSFLETRLNQKIIYQSYVKKIDWKVNKENFLNKINHIMSKILKFYSLENSNNFFSTF
jgi:hypothetical protein